MKTQSEVQVQERVWVIAGLELPAESVRKSVSLLVAVTALAAIWFAPLNMAPQAKHALAISIFMVILWATEALEQAITGLLGCYLFWTLGVVNFSSAFAGFASDTPWFILAAMMIGAMVINSGLATRLAYRILPIFGSSYSRILLGMILIDFTLTFFIPAGPQRLVIIAAIAAGLVDAFGVAPKSNIGRGLFITLTYTVSIFDKAIIGSTPSILARGIIERIGQVPVYWSQWFIAYLPLDIITILFCWFVVQRLYPPEKKELPGGREGLRQRAAAMGPMTAAEKKCLLLVATAILLWVTDFIHHISPARVAIGVALAACAPFVGLLSREDLKKVNFWLMILMGTAISMGLVLRETKALDTITGVLFSWVGPHIDSPMTSTLLLYWSAFILHMVLSLETAMVSMSLPALMNFALQNGHDPLAIGMVWTFATGGKIFIYQSLVIITGYSFGYFEAKDVLKMGAILTTVESLILLFLVPLYWPLIGIS